MNYIKYLSRVSMAFCLLSTTLLSFAGPPTNTDFFGGDIVFEKDPDRRNVYRYIKEGLNLGDYHQVALAPVEIWIHPDSPYQGVQANSIKTVSDQLRNVMVATLEPDYPVVKQASGKTIAVRLAVTGIKLRKNKRKNISYTTIGMAVAAAQDDMLSQTSLSDAIIAADMVDAQTGERIAALVDRNMAADMSGNSQSWEEIEKTFEIYAKQFKKRLKAAR